jgi:hypothetical protein
VGLFPSCSGALHLIRPLTYLYPPRNAHHEHLGGSEAEISMDSNSCKVASYPYFCALASTCARTDSQWLPGMGRTEKILVSRRELLLAIAASQKRHRARSNRSRHTLVEAFYPNCPSLSAASFDSNSIWAGAISTPSLASIVRSIGAGCGAGGRMLAGLARMEGWMKSATAMHPPLSYLHCIFPTVVEDDITIWAGPSIPDLPLRTSPPIKAW